MPKLNLKTAEKIRDKTFVYAQKQVTEVYREAAKQINLDLSLLAQRNKSEIIREAYLSDLYLTLERQASHIANKTSSICREAMKTTVNGMAQAQSAAMAKLGMEMKFLSVPTDVIAKLATGQIYEGGWNLSNRIWGISDKYKQDIYNMVAEGVATNRPTYEIAKDLEKYVKPGAKKPWDWSKVYPGTNKVVDYNAQRLARTLIQHAYQQSFVQSTYKNPWVTGYLWQSAGIHGRTCDICLDRDGKTYKKDELPIDHPNGLCTFIAVMDKELSEIANEIKTWQNSPHGTFPEIDEFAKSLK